MSEPRGLDRVLAPAYDEDRTAATWQRIAEARAGRRRIARSGVVWAAAVGGVAIAAVVAIVVVRSIAGSGDGDVVGKPLAAVDPAIAVTEGAHVEAADVERAVVLDDGSKVWLGAKTRMQVLANAGDRFVTLLEHGSARYVVEPDGPRRWEIETSLATVEVVGTRFRVEHDATRLVVEVEHGVVVVRGERVPGRVARLTAGQRIEVTAAQIATTPVPVPVPDSVTMPPPPPSPPPSPPPPSPSPSPSKPLVTSVDKALDEADTLRAANKPAEAAELLDRALAVDGRAPGAGLAAFTLGRLALDLEQPVRAARAFQRVIELGSPHGLLEDAYARRAEALIRAGDRAAADAAVGDYERAYPDARRAAALRARLR